MKRVVLLSLATALVLSGCGASNDQSVQARQTATAKVTTRWKWDPNSVVAAPKGLIIEQAGPEVDASFVELKEGEGFVIGRKISQGRYVAAESKIIFPPTSMTPMELDMALKMDVSRVEVSFVPDARILHARWTGQGVPQLSMEFVRVQD